MRIALAGNQNSGKTSLFNILTGANQFVGNWPGVTVEKKEGKYRGDSDVILTDLPGVYSLSPYSPEEIVTREYLTETRPEAIINVVDGSNLGRNLFLTTQLLELGIPMVVALNFIDVVEKNGDKINIDLLSKKLGCPVVAVSAVKNIGVTDCVKMAINEAGKYNIPRHYFSGIVEHTIAHIEEAALHDLSESKKRFLAVKLFERDEKIIKQLNLPANLATHIDNDIKMCEEEFGDDSVSITTTERYRQVDEIMLETCDLRKEHTRKITVRIDKIVTSRVFAIPIFIVIMFLIYYVSITSIGTAMSTWVNEGLFGESFGFFGLRVPGLPTVVGDLLMRANVAEWLQSLVLDGIIAGVGAVIGFLPQMFVLFLFLAFLEACGYMSRIAFILDRVFKRFGLSGKSFIPILIGAGCAVPGVLASRTIESDKERRMTIIVTSFIPCSAKLPIIALIAGAVFGGAWWVAPIAYFVGIGAILLSGLILKKLRMFSGTESPFVMELPDYHMPTVRSLLRSTWDRGFAFVKRAGSVILLMTIAIWFLTMFGYGSEGFGFVSMNESLLARFGSFISVIFRPLGFGNWEYTVAALTGQIAKETVVSTLSVIYTGAAEVSENGMEIWSVMRATLPAHAAFSFLVFNLLISPCAAAVGAIRREMNSSRWFWFAIGYQTLLGYTIALIVYQMAQLFITRAFSVGTAFAFLLVALFLFLTLRREPKALQEFSNAR